jgi:hypothetical protein
LDEGAFSAQALSLGKTRPCEILLAIGGNPGTIVLL